MKCPNCHIALPETSAFCYNCGVAIPKAPQAQGGGSPPPADASGGGAGAAPLPPPPKSVAPDKTPVPIKEMLGKKGDPRFRSDDPAGMTFSHLANVTVEVKMGNPKTRLYFMIASGILLVTGIVLAIIFLAKVEKKKEKEHASAAATADAGADARRPEPPRPPPPWRKPPEPSVAQGKHDGAAVQKALMEKYDDIYKCFEKAFKQEDTLELAIAVKKTGVVEKIDIVSNSSGKREVEGCVQGVIEKTRFAALGKREKKGSVVKWTLINTPSKPPPPPAPAPRAMPGLGPMQPPGAPKAGERGQGAATPGAPAEPARPR